MPRPPIHDAIRAVADRIYERDKVRFRKLVVWIYDVLERGWSVDRIRRALLALNKRESEGQPIEAWWPWLNAALEKVRTIDLEKQNDGYKTHGANNIRAILAQIYREISKG